MDNLAVLVVDDEPSAREVLSLTFELAGYTVLSAEDGEEALRLVEEAMPDVIVTDIHMPRVSGRAFALKLHRRFGKERPPVVATTADPAMVDRLQGDPAFFAVLPKPVDALALLETVRRALNGSAE